MVGRGLGVLGVLVGHLEGIVVLLEILAEDRLAAVGLGKVLFGLVEVSMVLGASVWAVRRGLGFARAADLINCLLGTPALDGGSHLDYVGGSKTETTEGAILTVLGVEIGLSDGGCD